MAKFVTFFVLCFSSAVSGLTSQPPVEPSGQPNAQSYEPYWHKVFKPDVLPVWIGGLAALFASMAGLLTLRNLKEQARTGLLAADGAEKGAKAAFLSAQAVMNAERAWIFAELGWYEGTLLRVVNGAYTGEDGPVFDITANLKLICKNEGRSPAWIDHVYARMDIVSAGSDIKDYDRKQCGNHRLIGPIGASGEDSRSLQLVCDGRFKEGDFLSIYVILEYHDIFETPRKTTRGYSLTSDGHLARQDGLPGRNRNT